MCSVFLSEVILIGECVYNRKWLTGAKLSWAVKGFKGDKHKTMCCVFYEVINIESMGESALKSYMKGRNTN